MDAAPELLGLFTDGNTTQTKPIGFDIKSDQSQSRQTNDDGWRYQQAGLADLMVRRLLLLSKMMRQLQQRRIEHHHQKQRRKQQGERTLRTHDEKQEVMPHCRKTHPHPRAKQQKIHPTTKDRKQR